MKKTDGWMPLYVADYLADTTRLSTEQHGAYLLLIMDYWRNGSPDSDDETLAAITKLTVSQWKKHASKILPMFKQVDGKLFHKRIEEERKKADEICGKRSASGKEGANKRWSKTMANAIPNAMPNAIANGMANGWQSASQNDAPSPSPSPPIETGERTPSSPAGRPTAGTLSLVPDDFRPDRNGIAKAGSVGLKGEELETQIALFVSTHRGNGTLKADWQQAWIAWCLRETNYRRTKPDGVASLSTKPASERICAVCGAPSLESIGHTWYCDAHAKVARKNPNSEELRRAG